MQHADNQGKGGKAGNGRVSTTSRCVACALNDHAEFNRAMLVKHPRGIQPRMHETRMGVRCKGGGGVGGGRASVALLVLLELLQRLRSVRLAFPEGFEVA